MEHFVPTYLSEYKVYYCGENKPSVDTPIQLRLYEKLPNINYMIDSFSLLYRGCSIYGNTNSSRSN